MGLDSLQAKDNDNSSSSSSCNSIWGSNSSSWKSSSKSSCSDSTSSDSSRVSSRSAAAAAAGFGPSPTRDREPGALVPRPLPAAAPQSLGPQCPGQPSRRFTFKKFSSEDKKLIQLDKTEPAQSSQTREKANQSKLTAKGKPALAPTSSGRETISSEDEIVECVAAMHSRWPREIEGPGEDMAHEFPNIPGLRSIPPGGEDSDFIVVQVDPKENRCFFEDTSGLSRPAQQSIASEGKHPVAQGPGGPAISSKSPAKTQPANTVPPGVTKDISFTTGSARRR